MPTNDPVLREALTAAAKALLGCHRLLVLCGAGASADSGVPTFRDEGGLWRTHRSEDLAHPDGFARDPALVWAWYKERRALARRAEPHAGLRSLALLQRLFHAGTVLVATTNEDDLLERAGVDRVIHLHGSFFTTRCTDRTCGWTVEDRDDAYAGQPCPRCGAAVRPGSVWFAEPLIPGTLEAVEAFAADGCLLVGSSCQVAPASQLPIEMAARGLPVVELNPSETPASPVATVLRGSAAALLPHLTDLLTSHTVRDQALRHSG